MGRSICTKRAKIAKMMASASVMLMMAMMSLQMAFAWDVDVEGSGNNNGISKLFGQGKGIATSIMGGFQGIVFVIAVAAAIYNLIRAMLASNPNEVATYRKNFIAIVILAFLAAFAPNLISWIGNLGKDLSLA